MDGHYNVPTAEAALNRTGKRHSAMAPPNALHVVLGEVSLVVTALRRSTRWQNRDPHATMVEEAQDPILQNFAQLKAALFKCEELSTLDPNVFLSPFLEVVRSEDTSGPITGIALTSLSKFLSYGLVGTTCSDSAATAVENIADAVTHARFVGTDASSDEVVLMKILHVLRTIVLTPVGALLTNEAVCEIMQSCFRICFEMRLSELLRKAAEHTLVDMIQLLFSRLPQFHDDVARYGASTKRLKIGDRSAGGKGAASSRKSPRLPVRKPHLQGDRDSVVTVKEKDGSTTPDAAGDVVSPLSDSAQGDSVKTPPKSERRAELISTTPVAAPCTPEAAFAAASAVTSQETLDTDAASTERDADSVLENQSDGTCSLQGSDFVNPRGVRFTAPAGAPANSTPQAGSLVPYGLPCVRELFRFLISLINPNDRHNSDVMTHMGVALVTVALESGVDHIPAFPSLLALVKDDLCKNVFALLNSERLSLFLDAVRVCYLLFESLRSHLKLQMERYFLKLAQLVTAEAATAGAPSSPKERYVSFEQKEIALESIVSLWRLPGLAPELYLNYDCDKSRTNLFEDLTKLLSKNAFPVAGIDGLHVLSLDALLAVVDSIEGHCTSVGCSCASHQNICAQLKSTSLSSSRHISVSAPPPTNGFMTGEIMTSSSASGFEIVTAGRHHRASGTNVDYPVTSSATLTGPGVSGAESGGNVTTSQCLRAWHGVLVDQLINKNLPTPDTLATRRRHKAILLAGIDQFNADASKGIAFLQDQGLLDTPVNPQEVARFLRENASRVDKSITGEYVSKKKNAEILKAFVGSFAFAGVRIDEALRSFLEAFRLPGEAPLISHILEHFAEEWTAANDQPFANTDAAFTLAYAVIMLNVDQHNKNVRKQTTPMTVKQFKTNLRKTNGNGDFDQEMLEDIFVNIKENEIVMPDEQKGLVKENYQWKVLLKNASTEEGEYLHVPHPHVRSFPAGHHAQRRYRQFSADGASSANDCQNNDDDEEDGESTGRHVGGYLDHDLFVLAWGPTIAALSFVFDKSEDAGIAQKAVAGFKKCALVAATYGLSDVFDNLVISLCKFTTLMSSSSHALASSSGSGSVTGESGEGLGLAIYFGNALKAQLAARTVFSLAHKHGDILREGWKNLLDCIFQLYKTKLLPAVLIEAEDFVDATGKVTLPLRKLNVDDKPVLPRNESGLFNSVYSYFTLAPTSETNRSSAQQPGGNNNQDAASSASIGTVIGKDDKDPTSGGDGNGETPMATSYSRLLQYLSPEDREAFNRAQHCIFTECHPESLVTDSRFLRLESLHELVKALIFASQSPEAFLSQGTNYDEEASVFFLEVLLGVVLQNRDRLATIWPSLREHLYALVLHCDVADFPFLLERAVVALLRLAIRLLHKEELAPQVLSALKILLLVKPTSMANDAISRQIAFGLQALVRANTGARHGTRETWRAGDWALIFTLMEVVGGGAKLPSFGNVVGSEGSVRPDDRLNTSWGHTGGVQSDTEMDDGHEGEADRGYTSDSDFNYENVGDATGKAAGNWLFVGKEGDIVNPPQKAPTKEKKIGDGASTQSLVNQYNITLHGDLGPHDSKSMFHCVETLVFLVQESAQITAENFEACVHCVRTFAEASANGGYRRCKKSVPAPPKKTGHKSQKSHGRSRRVHDSGATSDTRPAVGREIESDAEVQTVATSSKTTKASNYQTVSVQLLDLMHTLLTQATSTYASVPADDESMDQIEPGIGKLWSKCWCPLLQGMARLCCDARVPVRTSAITYLQRALLVHDLRTLTAVEWESCFNKVLFPLLAQLLDEGICPQDLSGLEEIRMRAATLLSKVFLQHLSSLLSLATFAALWLTILDFMDKFMHASGSELLMEAIPESLKNMLLVMETAGVFDPPSDGTVRDFSTMSAEQQQQLNQQGLQLWDLTWHRIELFLPNLRDEDPFKSKNESLRQQHERKVGVEVSGELQGDAGVAANESTELKDARAVEVEVVEAGALDASSADDALKSGAGEQPAKSVESDAGPKETATSGNDVESNPIMGADYPPPITMPVVVPPLPASGIETAPGVDIDEAFQPTASSSSQFVTTQPPVIGNVILEAPTPISAPMIMTRTEL